jgi:plastocyanin
MHRIPVVRPALGALAALALLAPVAHAAQVRVEVFNFAYAPRAANLNPGDHVTWIWTGGTHTVTQGDSASLSIGAFNTGNRASSAGTNTAAFSWRFPSAGTTLYYCIPHAPEMAGRVIVSGATGLPKADLRITEVLYNATATGDLIEITNLGTAAGDLGRWRIAVNGVATVVAANSFPVPAGGSVVVHCVAGTNTATDLFLSGLGNLPDSTGTLALYAPNTVNTALTDATQMVDFVKWGVTANALESIATGNGYWSSIAVPTVGAPGRAIAYCGVPGQYGPTQWGEVSAPTFGSFGTGSQNCTTPAHPSTWGRVKSLYR